MKIIVVREFIFTSKSEKGKSEIFEVKQYSLKSNIVMHDYNDQRDCSLRSEFEYLSR